MTLEQLADVADLLAALGVIASLLFVAYEVRRNTNEVKRTNFESLIDRFNTLWSRTSGVDLPDILQRGREDYESLSDQDKISFGNYFQELCLTYETLIVLGRNQIHGEEVADIPKKHLRYHFSFPGTRQWWAEFSASRGLSPVMNRAINEAIEGVTESDD